MKMNSVFRTAFACLLGAVTAVAAYQHFWPHRISAQNTTTTTMLIPWFSGSDAGYTSLLSIENASMSPYSTTGTNGTCTASAYYNGSLADRAPWARLTPEPSPCYRTGKSLPRQVSLWQTAASEPICT